MMDETPIQTARRLSRREEQDRCTICGRKLPIEMHHVAGRNFDAELTGPLCKACHAQVTENLRRANVDMRYTPDSVERVRRSLKATAVFLRMLAEALWRWAESLLESDSKQD
jgi:CRISPR/Cas system-associated protein Cas10 (large subunit of type III CRISPR-Cas system)